MTKVRSFRDLEVWQIGMDLVVSVYKATEALPSSERFGLTSQVRRAVVSIPSNVAEGHARRSDGVFLNHVKVALGSQAEVLTQIEVARRLGYLQDDVATTVEADIDRTRQMLHGLRRTLERDRLISAARTSAGILLAIALIFF